MNYEYLKQLPEAKKIKKYYEPWLNIMEENLEFWMKNSEKHTKMHCARVMLYALLIGKERNLPEDEMEVLAQASAFHDSRRQDDWLDTGHGGRAAAYYEEYCKENSKVRYDERTRLVIAYHDRDDQQGIEALSMMEDKLFDSILLYQIFKDADALDRFRLGSGGFNSKYLRTSEAKSLVIYAKEVLKKCQSFEQETK